MASSAKLRQRRCRSSSPEAPTRESRVRGNRAPPGEKGEKLTSSKSLRRLAFAGLLLAGMSYLTEQAMEPGAFPGSLFLPLTRFGDAKQGMEKLNSENFIVSTDNGFAEMLELVEPEDATPGVVSIKVVARAGLMIGSPNTGRRGPAIDVELMTPGGTKKGKIWDINVTIKDLYFHQRIKVISAVIGFLALMVLLGTFVFEKEAKKTAPKSEDQSG